MSARKHPRSPLLATGMQGQQSRARGACGGPRPPQPPQTVEEQAALCFLDEDSQWGYDQVISRSCAWITANLQRFLPPAEQIHPDRMFELFKPVNELALILFILTAPPHRQQTYSGWAVTIAQQIASELNNLATYLDWRDIAQRSATSRFIVLPLLTYPLIEMVTGDKLLYRRQIEELVRRTPPGAPLEIHFLNSLSGRDQGDAELNAYFIRILPLVVHADVCSSSMLYDLTHIVFYLTHFGRRPLTMFGERRAEEYVRLADLALTRIQMGDYDLGAELLMCLIYAGGTSHQLLDQAAHWLLKGISEDGSIPGPARATHSSMDHFEARYHTTLVTLAALAELRGRSDPGRP